MTKVSFYQIICFSMLVIIVAGCASGFKTVNEIPADNNKGYVRFFSNSLRHSITVDGNYVGRLKQPQWPFASSSMALLKPTLTLELPVGEYEIIVSIEKSPKPLTTSSVNAKDIKGTIQVTKDQMTLVSLYNHILDSDFDISNGKASSSVTFKSTEITQAQQTLPVVSRKSFKFEPVPEHADAYIELLKDPYWGIRRYAAMRLHVLDIERSLSALKEALAIEDNEDAKMAMQKAVKSIE